MTGCIYLALFVNTVASLLALLTLLWYLFFYTPLKRRTPFCVVVGAFAGAMPPLIGWAGASSRFDVEAWTLYWILFLWQFPHFMAIAWMYREDYDRAGYLMVPAGGRRFYLVALQALLPLIVLIPISLLALSCQHAGAGRWVALPPGLGFIYFGAQFVVQRSRAAARRLLLASIVYLPLWFVLSAILCNPVMR
jgi:protoheme IX farnesyltransferase